MSQSLIAFDTDHIKGYVFGTNRLREIRGASSRLDSLNRIKTREVVEDFKTRGIKVTEVYAHGGSALFIIALNEAERLGKAVQKRYREGTGGGASITYAIQEIPGPDREHEELMEAEELDENVKMEHVLKLLRLCLRLAKDSQQLQTSLQVGTAQDEIMTHIAPPSHALLCTCESCGAAYAEYLWPEPGQPEKKRYCRVCISKCQEDKDVKDQLDKGIPPKNTLWGAS